jgi:hypothetical protein
LADKSGVGRLRYLNKKYTLAQQYASLAYSRGLNGSGKLTRHGFRFDFKAKPTPLSREYSIRITMKRGKSPNIYVLKPNLTLLADGRRIPHLYSQEDHRLCLYLPETNEWDHGKSLASTIVPWTILWLYYFEEWLLSNEWKGGGEHPSTESAGSTSSGLTDQA